MTELDLQKEYMRQARENLRPFQDWLEEVQGYRANEASLIVALVCRATYESSKDGIDPDPVNILDRDIAHHQWYRLRSALRYYYAWLLRQDPTKKPYYQRQQSRIQIARFTKISTQPTQLPAAPVSQDVYKKLVRNVKRWCQKHQRRYPWIWPFISLKIKLGWRWTEILYLERSNLREAVARGTTHGAVSITRKGTKNKPPKTLVAPLKLIRPEVEQLLAWPWDWNMALEIAPHTTRSRAPYRYVVLRCGRAYDDYLKKMLPKEVAAMHRVAIAARVKDAQMIWTLIQLKGDWLALSQIVGMTMTWLKKKPQLLEVGQ